MPGRFPFLRLSASTVFWVTSVVSSHAQCALDRVDLRGDWGQARFTVEIADTPKERSRGLMQREDLPASHGMLFMFDRPQNVSFWMKDTLIPLDMMFVSENGTVMHIHENAVPLDETPIPGGSDILAVLEINGGLSERLGVVAGTVLRHPKFNQDIAVWPCHVQE